MGHGLWIGNSVLIRAMESRKKMADGGTQFTCFRYHGAGKDGLLLPRGVTPDLDVMGSIFFPALLA